VNRYKLLALVGAGALVGHLLGFDTAQAGIICCCAAGMVGVATYAVRVGLAMRRRGGSR
jgi:hypothetical protein